MPSGAKKRKAARKKKEKESITNNPQGNNGLKSQDEKGSDGGEGGSTAYHEHDEHHHTFNDGSGEVDKRDPSAAQSHAYDVKSMQEVPSDVKIDQVSGGKEGNVVLVERGLKSEESSGRKSVSFEHVEAAQESHYVNGNGGDTSKGESLTEKNSKDENCKEEAAYHELGKSIDSSISKMTSNSINENGPVEKSVNSVKAMASVSEVENSDTGSVLLEKPVVHPVEVINAAMKINKDSLINETVTKSNMEEPKPEEYESKVLDSRSASPFTKFSNGAEHIKDSETAEFSEDQLCVASDPNVVQKTSWLSCCGLFEALSSSNR
ncbi:uncharacterized protein LOC113858435 [Abrus precatorius]|uniref:Uncharacterized protein LOC113858435 n=1 Tax=Abrus precatorius TaxID=3816 RepID=A0A8B8KWP0_ABRPR|nr:uncharacterized protein LOC113858435 [Abrus precatorius]XP_027346899.1 uncharacterized protein LOC113858435 [Abrus precatorius]